jgi:hypothetical protein
MAKPLPSDDFRSVRIVLEPDDFAVGSEEPDPPPCDLIPKETWDHLVTLSDDVSVRTSNRFGTLLKDLSELEHEFVCVVLAIQESVADIRLSPIAHAGSMVCADYQASIFSALTGYYRLAFTALRSVVENMAVGMHLELSSDQTRFQQWLGGEALSLGWAADLAPGNAAVAGLEAYLRNQTQDDFFRQRRTLRPNDDGGFARRLFGTLSRYTHGGPGFSDSDLRQSNGPIFVGKVFLDWAVSYVQTLAFSLIACKLAMPTLDRLGGSSELTLAELYEQVRGTLRPGDDGVRLLGSLPAGFW